jgi:hypothetical protein
MNPKARAFFLSLACTLVGVASLPGHVLAQPASGDLAGEAVRQLVREGDQAFGAGDYAVALERFERAYASVRVPTLGLYSARSLEKLGRLVEASRRYDEVTRLPLPAKKREVHEKAQQDAATELAALRPRIPRLVVVLAEVPGEGALPADATVSVDGRGVPLADLEKGLAVDPGTRRVELVSGSRVARREVVLAEGESKRVEIALDPVVAAAPIAPAPGPRGSRATAPPPGPGSTPAAGRADGGPSALAAAGWGGIALGGIGLVTGAIAGGIAWGQNDALDESSCVDDVCDPEARDDVDSYMQNRAVATAGFLIGGVAAAAGATLLIIDFASGSSGGSSASLWVGPQKVGIVARF